MPSDVSVRSCTNRRRSSQCSATTTEAQEVMSFDYGDDEQFLTKCEVAQLCRVDVRTVERWLTAGKLTCHRTPSGRSLFRKRDVLTVVARAQALPPEGER